MILDYIKYGFNNLRRQRLRSWLTMMGIFIGMASVVALISLGQGLESSINEQFEKMGVDKLFIMPQGIFGSPQTSPSPLTEKDFRIIERTKGIDDASGMLIETSKIEFNDQIRYFMTLGIEPEDPLIKSLYDTETEFGRDLKKDEKGKVLLGNNFYTKELFEKNLKVRDNILLNDKEFKVVGFYKSFGNNQDDQQVYLPYDVVEDLYDRNGEYDYIVAKVGAGLDPEAIAEEVEENLRKDHGLKEGNEDFSIQTSKELMESFGTILNILQIFLVGIASISLLVGGIGIMNTMYTAVLQRTREIGVMKSIGARNKDILMIFLIESGILGLIGGGIGIILGISFSKLVEFLAAEAGYSIIKVSFPPFLIFGTLMFAFVVGSLSGIVPAYKASKLRPVDALRYE
jgi:putative ABC transport system permease protein